MMRIKYINPSSELPYVSEVTDAFMAHDVDDDGNELSSFVIILNCADDVEHAICIRGASFTKLTELINELYDNGKIDISTDADIEVIAMPKSILNILDSCLDSQESITPEMLDSILSSMFDDDDEDYDDEDDF